MRTLSALLVLGLCTAATAQTAAPTLAQALVARTMASHTQLTALTLHVDDAQGRNVVAGSNVAPLGKLADEDDAAVRRSPAPVAGVNPAGTRYGVAMPLKTRSGEVIGTVNFGYAYKPGTETAPLAGDAAAILADMETQIPSSAALFEPAG